MDAPVTLFWGRLLGLSVPPLAAEPRGTALYCSRRAETSRVGGGSREKGAARAAPAPGCALVPRRGVRGGCAACPRGPCHGPGGGEVSRRPAGGGRTAPQLQAGIGRLFWTGATSLPSSQIVWGTIRGGGDLHRGAGSPEVPSRIKRASGARAQALSGSLGLPRTNESGLWGALYRRWTGLGDVTGGGEGAFPL